jgi:hypothetical protein
LAESATVTASAAASCRPGLPGRRQPPRPRLRPTDGACADSPGRTRREKPRPCRNGDSAGPGRRDWSAWSAARTKAPGQHLRSCSRGLGKIPTFGMAGKEVGVHFDCPCQPNMQDKLLNSLRLDQTHTNESIFPFSLRAMRQLAVTYTKSEISRKFNVQSRTFDV